MTFRDNLYNIKDEMAKASAVARSAEPARRRVGRRGLADPIPVQAYRTKAEVAGDVIRGAILSGELAPGEELTVLALAQRFGLTLMPLREALSRLDDEGLLDMEAHRPARVAELSRERLQEEYFIRSLLESAAAAQATPHLDDDALDEIEALLRRMDAARDAHRPGDYWELTRQYHERIYAATPSPIMRKEVARLRARTRRYLPLFSSDQALVPEAQQEHWEIFRAIRKREPALVERLVRTHIEHVSKSVRLSARAATKVRVS
jgi:DNA-binding GntR family transcriptional regulator